jgi:hypothetical protein
MPKANTAGGSAAAGGINFQAAITAIAEVHVASGAALLWLNGIANDIPTAISSETGGPGDDIRLLLQDGSLVEVQIKRNLSAGDRLWNPLLELARALHENTIAYGLLIVSPDSSSTIRHDLARDILRMGDGRSDGLKSLALQFHALLDSAALPVQDICRRLRIVTVHAFDSDPASVVAARAELARLCADTSQIGPAWDRLLHDATLLIEHRGQRTSIHVLSVLKSGGIRIEDRDAKTSPLAILSALTRWAFEANASFTVFRVSQRLPLAVAWIPLLTIVQQESTIDGGLEEVLEQYHSSARREPARDANEIDPETIGRFKRHCVVTGGPGLGKSTLLKKLALSYSRDNYPVLKVRLSQLAARLSSTGCSVEEGLFALGLAGSDVPVKDAIHAGFQEWVVLCDGLDECPSHQDFICQGLLDLVAGHPSYRVVVVTRPVGYTSALLRHWRHYELLALRANNAELNIEILLRGIYDSKSDAFERVREFATAQLKNKSASQVVSLSPLLLGFAVSLAVRNIDFGQTKTQLYERLFGLIQEAPSDRTGSKGPSAQILLRFLDVFGWNLQLHPATQIATVLEHCVKTLAIELDTTRLNAATECEKCVQYWEQIGMLETLEHAGDKTISFVHKTFGEYAAARYLVALDTHEQATTVTSVVGNDHFGEVLKFAAARGMADAIVSELLKPVPSAKTARAMVNRCLELVNIPENPPSQPLRAEIFDRAYKLLASMTRRHAIRIGDALIQACPGFASEICPRAIPLLDHEQTWTRLAAWALVAIGGREYYELEDLVQAFKDLPRMTTPGMISSLSGGISLGEGNGNQVDEFAVAAITQILDAYPAAEAEELIRSVLVDEFWKTAWFSDRVATLLSSRGKSELAKLIDHSDFSALEMYRRHFGSSEYRQHQRAAYRLIFGALTVDQRSIETVDTPAVEPVLPHLNLSAFLSFTQFRGEYSDDDWALDKTIDVDAVTEALRGAARVIPIDRVALGREAQSLLQDLEACHTAETPFSVYGRTVNVDIDADWNQASKIELDIAKLERALRVQSEWLVYMAANLILYAASQTQRTELVQRVFHTGSDLTLLAAALLSQELDKSTARELLLTRLQQPLVPGCQYLFQALADLEVIQSAEMMEILRSGFFTQGPRTATQAAKLAAKVATRDNHELVLLLREAFRFWRAKEQEEEEAAERKRKEEQKKDGKVRGRPVPESPRESILEVLISMQEPSDDELIAYMSDESSDVHKAAERAWRTRLFAVQQFRDRLISDVTSERMSPSWLANALRDQVPFSNDQLAAIRALLTHPKPQIRYAAMGVLTTASSSSTEIGIWTEKLIGDPERQIRDRAVSIREDGLHLNPDPNPAALSP